MSATTMISGLDGCGWLELGLGGHPAVGQRVPGRSCGSRGCPGGGVGGAARGGRPATGSAGRWPAGAACISSREACMKSTSSGSGLRSVRAIASTPRSATRRRRISASIISCSSRRRASYSSSWRRAASGSAGDVPLLPGLSHEAGAELVEVELPQRPVQVVGAADRAAGLHAGELATPRRRRGAAALAVHGHRARRGASGPAPRRLSCPPAPPTGRLALLAESALPTRRRWGRRRRRPRLKSEK